MGFIVKSDPFSTNIQRINFVLELAEAQYNMYSGYVAGVFPKNANTKEETTNTNREEDKAVKMCKMVAKIKSAPRSRCPPVNTPYVRESPKTRLKLSSALFAICSRCTMKSSRLALKARASNAER